MNFIKKWVTVVPLCLSLSCATIYGETPVSGEYASFAIGTSGNDGDGISTISGIATSNMGGIYGQDKTTASELDLTFSGSDTEYWYAKCTSVAGVTYYATVKCQYEKGLLNKYDKCTIIEPPASGSCCFAAVYNDDGKVAYTDLAVGQYKSSTAKVKHTGNSVTFKVVFGEYDPD